MGDSDTKRRRFVFVMAGLVPAIHVFGLDKKDVDARQTLVLAIRRRRIALAGHDAEGVARSAPAYPMPSLQSTHDCNAINRLALTQLPQNREESQGDNP
jgi:hypothetical protein